MGKTGAGEDFIGAVTACAVSTLGHTQPWPNQFRRRSLEVRSLCRLHDFSAASRVLELGCGNALGSALLSEGRKLMVATDLERPDLRSHSIGLGKARSLLAGLGIQSCRVMAASGEALPFRDASFDLIFSLFVLEHVRDREACLAEIHRVLDDSGLAVHAVPGRMWALDAPLRFQIYLAQRLIARLAGRGDVRLIDAGSGLVEESSQDVERGFWSLFRSRYPDFPLPPPHGAYANYLDELTSYSRRRWVRLFERSGFEVLDCRPIMMLPLCLLHMVLGRFGLALYERLFRFDQCLADRKGLRGFGRFFGIVARKRQ